MNDIILLKFVAFFAVLSVINFQFAFSFEQRQKYGQALACLIAGCIGTVLFLLTLINA